MTSLLRKLTLVRGAAHYRIGAIALLAILALGLALPPSTANAVDVEWVRQFGTSTTD